MEDEVGGSNPLTHPMFTVYILQSLKNHQHYTGYTNDLERRLSEHNRGHTKSNRYFGPYKVVYTENYNTRSEAMKRERQLKSGKGREWLSSILVRASA